MRHGFFGFGGSSCTTHVGSTVSAGSWETTGCWSAPWRWASLRCDGDRDRGGRRWPRGRGGLLRRLDHSWCWRLLADDGERFGGFGQRGNFTPRACAFASSVRMYSKSLLNRSPSHARDRRASCGFQRGLDSFSWFTFQQIERRANGRSSVAGSCADEFDLPADFDVVDVRAIPRQQNIHS